MSVIRPLRFVAALSTIPLVYVVGARLSDGLSLTVNGSASPTAPIVHAGETYIPVSALRAAGAQVTRVGNRVTVSFASSPNTAEANLVSGKIDEWLSDGVWRLKVHSADMAENACTVTLELGNVSGVATYPAITGVAGLEIRDDKNQRIGYADTTSDSWSDLTAYDYVPGSTVVKTLRIGLKPGTAPAKLVLVVAPNADKRSIMKTKGLKFAGPPSFTVQLKAAP